MGVNWASNNSVSGVLTSSSGNITNAVNHLTVSGTNYTTATSLKGNNNV